MNIGIIGSGMISGRYIGSIQEKFPELKICGIASNDMPQCRAKAVEFGLEPMEVSELLAREDIEMVIVLVPWAFTTSCAARCSRPASTSIARRP